MQLKINSCGVSDCAPKWEWTTAPHGFGDYDLWAVFRGIGTIIAHTEKEPPAEYHLQEGACFLLAPNTVYTAYHEPSCPLLVINVHFDFLNDNGIFVYPFPKPQAKNVASPMFFKTLLMRTVTLFNSKKENAAHTFFAAALEEFQSAEALGSPDNPWVHIVNEICEQTESFKKSPTLSELSRKYGYSERYIGKMFKKMTGLSFSDYMLNSRISKAKMLLRFTNASMAAIAEETGFYDACHFSRCFRTLVGMSPSKFRKG